MEVNVVPKRAGTILNDAINSYFLFGFMASVLELNCHTSFSRDSYTKILPASQYVAAKALKKRKGLKFKK
jgi:hypothetical protein